MQIELFIILIFCSLLSIVLVEAITCQGSTYDKALQNCPDNGAQKFSAGGHLTVKIMFAFNVPNMDHTGPAAGVSDPYVKFTFGAGLTAQSKVIRNNLSPVWNEMVPLGFVNSATELRVEVWDYDIGLEYSDDFIAGALIRVPHCSTFRAKSEKVPCRSVFGCESRESLWANPVRQLCNETTWVNFNDKDPLSQNPCRAWDLRLPNSMPKFCLKIQLLMVPFTSQIELLFPNMVTYTPLLSALGPQVFGAPWTLPPSLNNSRGANFGYPFLNDINNMVDLTGTTDSKYIAGALMWRFSASDRYIGPPGAVNMYFSINFPAYVYVCRDTRDDEKGIPAWLNYWDNLNNTATRVKFAYQNVYLECFYQISEGTVKNKYGGVISGAIPLHVNSVPGHVGPSSGAYYYSMYTVLAVPRVIPRFLLDTNIAYSGPAFIQTLFLYGILCFWFTYIGMLFLSKINYRLDRIMPYLVSLPLEGDDKNVLAYLFVVKGETPCNVHYRARLFHGQTTLLMLTLFPFSLLLSWGFNCAVLVSPQALGLGICWLGIAGLLFWYGYQLWKSQRWRMTYTVVTSFALAILFCLVFILAVIFADPLVTISGQPVNFPSISLLFGTINCVPCIFLIFKKDKRYKNDLLSVIEKMTTAVYDIAALTGKPLPKNKKKTLPANKSLHELLGKCYTLNPNVPILKLGSVLQDTVKEEEDDDDLQEEKKVYYTSLFILFLYLMIAVASTAYPSVAFLNCLTLILFDYMHVALDQGNTNWSPGYKISLLVLGRLLIMTSDGGTWLLNYSLAFIVYGVFYIDEMINLSLPMMSKAQAGEIAFTGKDAAIVVNLDLAGTPYFCFFLLTFSFISIILVSIYGDKNALPVDSINVYGLKWSTSVFGVIAVMVLVTGGLMMATSRAYYLKANGLLKGFAKAGYFWDKGTDIPLIFGILTEISIVFTGIVISAATGATAILILGIFLPPISGLLVYAYSVWVNNDYELVKWPPPVEAEEKVESASELDVAFDMIKTLFAEDEIQPETLDDVAIEQGESRTMTNFTVPPLEVTSGKIDGPIKMPPLPLKSVLRKKREKMGIKVKAAPIVQDLRAREGAEIDKFGSGEVVNAADPWAEFEEKEEEVAVKKKVKKNIAFKVVRRSIWEHPYILKTQDALQRNRVAKFLISCFKSVLKKIEERRKAYQRIDPDADDEDEDDEDSKDHSRVSGGDAIEGVGFSPFQKMNFWYAFFNGFLLREEYIVMFSWFGGLFLIFVMGIVLADYVAPFWLGHVIWCASLIFICTAVPMVRYFHTYVIDAEIKYFGAFVVVFHFLFCVCFFAVNLNSDIGIPGTLWILDFYLYFPAMVYMIFEFYNWVDNDYVIEVLDKDGDGNVTFIEILSYFRAYPVLVTFTILLNWQFYLWISTLVGIICLLILLTVFVGFFFIRDWATNDFYVSPEMLRIGGYIISFILLVTAMNSIFSSTNPILSLCVFFVTLICRLSSRIFSKLLLRDPDGIMFVSPFVLPVYSYNAKTNDVIDETPFMEDVLALIMTGFVWGFFLSIFLYPVSTGVTITCFFLLAFSVVLASAVSLIPCTLGSLCTLTTTETIRNAAETAVAKFNERKTPLNLTMAKWFGEAKEEFALAERTHIDMLKDKAVIELAVDLIQEIRSLSFIKADEVQLKVVEDKDEDEVILTWYQEQWKTLKEIAKKAFEKIPKGQMKGYKRHSESLFTFLDCAAESIIVGRGPLGFLGLNGYVHKGFLLAQEHPRLKFLQQPWLNSYDENGNFKDNSLMYENINHQEMFSNILACDQAIDYVYYEETRCAIHFLSLLVASANAKLQRETVLFQKFLRENRFRLASNGITPPPEIFSSSSFTSIDIPLVAVWLTTLTQDERERFAALKMTFSEEQRQRDINVDEEDRKLAEDAEALALERVPRELDMSSITKKNAEMELKRKMDVFMESLSGAEKDRFMMKMTIWKENADAYIDSKDQNLYDKFKAACLSGDDAITDFAQHELNVLEAALKDCRLGEYGRQYQFVDPVFSPGDYALGRSQKSSAVLGWRCAPGISETCRLFEGGAEPDDVQGGIYNNQWLLSAICMIAAGGGSEEEVVTDALKKVFIGHITPEGDESFTTEVGAYCVRLFKQGLWNPIIVDDLFPMRQHADWTNENKGIAVAHTKECNELWVSVIEKAFAKYYGSYSELERGYVHHALRDLTGCESECVSLGSVSRGIGKRTLWEQLLRYKSNDYILGVGTGSKDLADKEIQEMGIVFDASYTIYDIRQVDGYQLLKLRNPPGDHEEWKGDWGDRSDLWTKRLKKKLGWSDVDDNTFWMSFDDFCNVFRYLYVCKFYSRKWKTVVLPGIWKKSTELEQENKDQLREMIMKSDDSLAGAHIDKVEEKKKKAKSRVDTSGGLPTKHNPKGILENNPNFSLMIFRPTDFKITVSQTDSRGVASANDLVPFSIYVCLNENTTEPKRVKALTRENVVLHSGEPKAEMVQYIYGSLNPGLYMVVVPCYVTGQEGNFTVSLVSNYRADFISIWPPMWMMKKTKSKELNLDSSLDKTIAAGKDMSKAFRKGIRDLLGSGVAEDDGSGSDEEFEDS